MSQSYYQEPPFSFGFGGEGITHAVQRLILFNALIFAVLLFISIPFPGMNMWLVFTPGLFEEGYSVWTPLTYMFIHGGIWHLFTSMLTIFFFGPIVERALSTRQFYTFYVVCGVFAVLIGWLLSTLAGLLPLPLFLVRPDFFVLGAHPIGLAILVASAILEPERKIHMRFLPFPITYRGILIVSVAFDLLYLADGRQCITVFTNFGGMIAGYCYMKARPLWSKYQLRRKVQKIKSARKKPSKQEEDLADAIDNIFDFKNK